MLELIPGDNNEITGTVYTDSTHTTPVSLSDAVEMTFRARRQDGARTVVFTKTLTASGGITVVSAAAGTFAIAIVPNDTASLNERSATLDYDLKLTRPGPSVKTIDRGTLEFEGVPE